MTKINNHQQLRLHGMRHLFYTLTLSLLFMLHSSVIGEVQLRINKTADAGIKVSYVDMPGDIDDVITADLKRTGEFVFIDAKTLPGLSPYGGSLNGGPLTKHTQYLIRSRQAANTVQLELISLSDMRVHRFSIQNTDARRIAHQLADKIYQQITKRAGAFDSKIAYVSREMGAKGVQFNLYVADSDGYRAKSIFKSSKPVMSPAWSPDSTHLAYVSFESGQSAIYTHDVYTGKKTKISSREGINSSPAWSPDGSKLALVLSDSGNSDIYIAHLAEGKLKDKTELERLTTSHAIDTEPTWQSNNSLYFTSNRGGEAQVYSISYPGKQVKRLTYKGDSNSAADVRGDFMAFVRRDKEHFRIGISSAEKNNEYERVLTQGSLDESPSLSANGSMILYSGKFKKQSRLAVTSANGQAQQILFSVEGDVRDPAWSNLLGN